jgi:hypothetical protein
MNTDPIANLRMGGEIGHESAHFMYRSCRDTIRIQILNWSESCRNSKMEPRYGSNPSPNMHGTHVVLGNNSDWGIRSCSKPGPQPGNPELLLTLEEVIK